MKVAEPEAQQEGRHQADQPDVDSGCVREEEAPRPAAETWTIGDVQLEVGPALANKAMANVSGEVRRLPALRGLPSALDRPQSHPYLRLSGGLGQLFHRLAIAVAAQEVHAQIRTGRVALQHLLDQADGLEILAPVERGAETKARDYVRHRDLGRRLTLMFAPDRVLGGHLLGGEVGVDGGAEGGKAGAVLAQAL